jgi:hypothetical protein
MSKRHVVSVVIALLLMTASTAGLLLIEGGTGIGISIYAVVAIAAITLSRARPTQWPGCLFDVANSSRTVLAHRLLTQLAALVCLLLAQCLSGRVSQTLSIAGLLLFIHTLVLARAPHLLRPRRAD